VLPMRDMMKFMLNKSPAFSLKLFILLVLLPFLSWGQSSYDVWLDMTEAGVNNHTRRTYVTGAPGKSGEGLGADAGKYVMYGGEKEGSSALISRVMGPDKDFFTKWVENMPAENRKKFLVDFLTGVSNGNYRVRVVKNVEGIVQNLDLTDFKNVNFSSLDDVALKEKFQLFLDRAGDKSFSFLNPQTRMKIMNGKLSGLDANLGLKKFSRNNFGYRHFYSLFGDAEKYIESAHNTFPGWEINFRPQKSYGEFEYMISWFKIALKNAGQLFEAPGHQWIVYPKTQAMLDSNQELVKLVDKISEIHKNNQAYIVLKAIEGDAGIQYANSKSVLSQDKWIEYFQQVLQDEDLYNNRIHATDRGVVRLENNRFQVDDAESFAIEFRAGTKSDRVRRETQKFLISRYAAQDFDDIAPASSWELNTYTSSSADAISRRFGVRVEEAKKFIENISSVKLTKATGYGSTHSIDRSYLVPLWEWENAPYLSASKKAELRQLTEAFIKTVAQLPNPNASNVGEAMKSWAHTSRLSSDIENYLRPKPRLSGVSAAGKVNLQSNYRVNVNDVDVGIEYTARYPLKKSAEYANVPNQPGKIEWLRTSYEYSKDERREILKRAAQGLAKNLNEGNSNAVSLMSGADEHGHGLDVAYEFTDAKGRKWRVEWDGIGRSYDTAGNLIPESLRGGHIEIVTPKFNPTQKELEGVFSALERESLVPSIRSGGGHVNIDLSPFIGKPKELARFLGTYYDNRNMMTLLFQHPGRGVGAEPNRMSQSLINKLKNFDGTEDELKKILYDEKFFNTRVGRKTKNNQLNLIAYFQDVIPEQFIHQDFDMKNDIWRRTFEVNPKIRKMEFRLFNAPRNAAESALQIKFVRAMMNKALNEDSTVFRGNYEVNTGALAKDPQRAATEFERTMRDLNLDPSEYRGFYTEGLALNKAHIENPSILTNEQKLAMHPEVQDWGRAVEPRTTAIGSEGRLWLGTDVLPEARQWKQSQLQARQFAERARRTSGVQGRVSKLAVTGGTSIVSGNRCRSADEVIDELLN
jgi:hypothetical protein